VIDVEKDYDEHEFQKAYNLHKQTKTSKKDEANTENDDVISLDDDDTSFDDDDILLNADDILLDDVFLGTTFSKVSIFFIDFNFEDIKFWTRQSKVEMVLSNVSQFLIFFF
jgi:hypothetical protein